MKIVPAIGMAFIKEDKRDYGNTKFEVSDHMKKGIGTTGVVLAITNLPNQKPTVYWDSLRARISHIEHSQDIPEALMDIMQKFCEEVERGHQEVSQYQPGDHVVFSKFNEQICVYENGKELIYFCVPVQAILGALIDV